MSTSEGHHGAPGDNQSPEDSPPNPYKDNLRLPRPDPARAGADIPLFMFRALPGEDELTPLGKDDKPPAWTFGLDEELAAEKHLGRAEVPPALAIADTLTRDEPTPSPDNHPSPRGAVGITIRVRAYLLEGRVDEARRALGTWRDRPELALADALVSLSESDVDRADRRLGDALRARPEGFPENLALALFKASTGDAEDAMALFARAAATIEEHAVARHLLGKLTADNGDPARAGTLFEMAWELAPQFVAPAMTMAEMFIDARQYGEAMNLLNAAAERAPTLLAPRLMQLKLLLEARKAAAALPLAEALRQAAPLREDVTLMWAETLMQLERGEEARGALEGLLGRDPGEPHRVHALLARLALSRKPQDLEGARRSLLIAVEARPDQAEMYVELAQVQLALKDREGAIKALERLENVEVLEMSTVLSAAVLAGRNGLSDVARRLGRLALENVAGTPAESQVRAILDQFNA